MHIELVVFDMAGTTLNDRAAVNEHLRAALSAAGLDVAPAAVNAVMGLPKPNAIRQLIARSPRATELVLHADAIHTEFVDRMKHFYATDTSVCEIPGSTQVFRQLRQLGMKTALNTGFSRDIVRVILDRLGWREGETIDSTITSDEVPRGRPHPDMIRALMNRLGVANAARVAKVGDTPVDLLEGSNAGCGLVIGVTRGSHTRSELEVHPHTHLIETVAELPALLRSLGCISGPAVPEAV